MAARAPRALRWSMEAALVTLLFTAVLLDSPAPTPADPPETSLQIFGSTVGADLAARLGPLNTLAGEPVQPEWTGLRLWVLVDDQECLSCLFDLPLWAALMDSLVGEPGRSAVVAIGDRHEARRTFYGSDPGMPVLVAAKADLPASVSHRTPIRLLTWQGRVLAAWPEALLVEAAKRSGKAHGGLRK